MIPQKLQDYILWLNRDKFLTLIHNFVNKKLVGHEFAFLFTELLDSYCYQSRSEKIKNILANSKTLEDFRNFKSNDALLAKNLVDTLASFGSICLHYDDLNVIDEELRKDIQKTFLPFLNNDSLDENIQEKEFLVYLEKLKNQPISSYSEDQATKLLENYSTYLGSVLFWSYRNMYYELSLDFLNNKITGEKFRNRFYDLYKSHLDEFKQLKIKLKTTSEPLLSLPIDSRAFKFEPIMSRMLYNIYILVFNEESDWDDDMDEPMGVSETTFCIRLKEIIYELEQLIQETD